MRKSFIIFIIFLSINICANDNFNINGINEISYVRKIAKDSLSNFFYDKFGFNLEYNNFVIGMKFIAKLPKYDSYKNTENLNNEDISYEWTDRYLSYNSKNIYLLGGKFEDSFGTGSILRAYQDEDFNIDTRLEGSLLKIKYKNWDLKTIYGIFLDENRNDKKNITYGIDIEKKISKKITIGTSLVSLRYIHSTGNNYSKYDIYGSRINFNTKDWELYAEISKLREQASKKEFENIDAKDGYAIYSNLNYYLGKFTFSTTYKKYNDFDYSLNDLPTVNHSNEPLSENYKTGNNEEGIMGELRYIPDFSNEFILNYSESWNNNFSVRLSDFYSQFRHDFDNFSLTTEYSRLERKENAINEWELQNTPSLSFDITGKVPLYIKTECEIHKKIHFKEEKKYYEPLLQTDFKIKNIGISLITETIYNEGDDFSKSQICIGGEISADIFQNTNIKLFAGKEKGGKVCRNGVCRYQSRFNGFRLEITTNF